MRDKAGELTKYPNSQKPYERLMRNVRLMQDYLKSNIDKSSGDRGTEVAIANLEKLIQAIGRKPNICFFGSFDAGKSTLANSIMFNKYLPADYAPMSLVPTYIRHSDDRPSWFVGDVWLMNSEFDPISWNNEKHCKQHRLQSGSYEVLENYGTHQGEGEGKEQGASALVFANAAILNYCNLVDLPGFDNDERDSELAKSNEIIMDIAFYLSPIIGFLRAADIHRIAQIIRKLPAFELQQKNIPRLGNLFIIASHVDPKKFNPQKIDKILNIGTQRIWKQLSETALVERDEKTDQRITQADIRSRLCTFWKDGQDQYISFDVELYNLLNESLPFLWHERADQLISEFSKKTVNRYLSKIEDYRTRLKDLENLEKMYNEYIDQEPLRKAKVEDLKSTISVLISEYSKRSIDEFSVYYGSLINQAALERLIKDRYTDKKEAEEYAIAYIIEKLQHEIKTILTPKTEDICRQTSSFLEAYKSAKILSDSKIGVGISFDEVTAFTSGLIRVTTLGALASWAITAGGTYLAANATGVLASIGVGLATVGTAILTTIGTVLSAVMGPIGIGIIAAFGLVAWIRGPWDRRLAKKILEKLSEEGTRIRLEKAISDYWASSLSAFEKGAEAVENEWQERLSELRDQIETPEIGRKNIEATLGFLERTKDFFFNIPWK